MVIFAIHCHESAMGVPVVPHPEALSHHPPHPIHQGHPSTPALNTLPHALNLDWRSISHMIIYMFQCYSLKSSHPHLLPESKSLFFTSVSLLLSCTLGHHYHLSNVHIYTLYTVLVLFFNTYFTLFIQQSVTLFAMNLFMHLQTEKLS